MKQIATTLFIGVLTFTASAQSNLSGEVAAVEPERSLLAQLVLEGGVFSLIIWLSLFVVSTIAIAVAIRLIWNIRRSQFMVETHCKKVDRLCEKGKFNDAFAVTDSLDDAYSVAMNAVFADYHEDDLTHDEVATDAVDKVVRKHMSHINILQTSGNIAPMLGLLGTVTGMVAAFMGLGTALGPEKASVLAVSISQALYTTASGLLISVPCLALVTYSRNSLEKCVQSLNDALTKTLRLVKKVPPEIPETD